MGSGVCELLVRRDALRVNPVRDVSRLERGRGCVTRALSGPQVRVWLRMLDADADADADAYAQRKDLPDLVRFLLATGVRLGEALAITWDDVDLDVGVVVVEWTVVRIVGRGSFARRPRQRRRTAR